MKTLRKKPKAPQNRTLVLSREDRSRLTPFLQPLPAQTLDVGHIRNKIFLGDASAGFQWIPNQSVDLLFLDPPYNLSKDYGEIQFQSKSNEDYEKWFESWFVKLLPTLKPHATIYVCCDWRTSTSVYQVLSRHLFVRNRITWEREKGRGALTNWKNNSEDIWYATVSKKDFTFHLDAVKLKRKVLAPYTHASGAPKDWEKTKEGNFRLTSPSNLWTDISVPFWSMPENTDHPTQKPEKLLAKLILASTHPGDLVFDPFLGSGTTAVTAKKLGRSFTGIEINPEFALWALKRLEKAELDPSIQGYRDGVFWERNSVSLSTTP